MWAIGILPWMYYIGTHCSIYAAYNLILISMHFTYKGFIFTKYSESSTLNHYWFVFIMGDLCFITDAICWISMGHAALISSALCIQTTLYMFIVINLYSLKDTKYIWILIKLQQPQWKSLRWNIAWHHDHDSIANVMISESEICVCSPLSEDIVCWYSSIDPLTPCQRIHSYRSVTLTILVRSARPIWWPRQKLCRPSL